MHQITTDQLTRLLAAHHSPCISLYLPTHRQHPDNEQDPIRYRNMLGEMEKSLVQEYPTREVRTILNKFERLGHEHRFWDHRTDGLAVFGSSEAFEWFDLQRPVEELLVVADSFHTKPLMRILQSADRYQILCLDRQEAKLYEGNRDGVDQVDLEDVVSNIAELMVDRRSLVTQAVGSYGTKTGDTGRAVHHAHGPKTDADEAETIRFFRAVDRGILEHHSRPSGLPLMLVALAETQAEFRRLSNNPFLLVDGISIDPDSLGLNALRERAWQKIEPTYLERLEKLKDEFLLARSRQDASGDLSDVAKAAVLGQVAMLLVEADRVIPGTLDRSAGSIQFADSASSHVDDLLDDLAEIVLAKGGEVVVVPADRMPTDSGLASIYRF